MKFLKYSLIALLTLLLVGGAGYLLASSGIEEKPGYVELDMPETSITDVALAVNLGPKGLKPVRWIVKSLLSASDNQLEDSERFLLGALNELKGAQIRIYAVEQNRQQFDQAIDEAVASLRQQHWQTLLRAKEDDKFIVVLQTGDDNNIAGLSVFASTPENAFFINLIGPFKPESIVAYAQNIDL